MITIIGAGMAGLLAGRMLSHRRPMILEKQKALPNNHSAVLRFRTSQIGDILGIPFRRVNMIKDSLAWQNPIADSLAYSYKNTGSYRSDRSIVRGLVSEERYIAPPDFIARMAGYLDTNTKLLFGQELAVSDGTNLLPGDPIISTIPMPTLMAMLNYETIPTFGYHPGATITATLANTDAYVSLLVPNPNRVFSRVSITGDQLIVECPKKIVGDDDFFPELAKLRTDIAQQAANLLGITVDKVDRVRFSVSTYNKILPIPEQERKEFMFWATKNFSIYSLGRYATWRPGLLLDDLVKDIRLIDGWMSGGGYDVALHHGRK